MLTYNSGDDALTAYQELFNYACPKFINCNPPPYHNAEALKAYTERPPVDAVQHQSRIFLSDVKTQLSNAHIRSFLRLYTSLTTDKLASFMDIDEEQVVEMMMILKNSTRNLKWTHGSLLEGEVINTSDLQFAIDTVRPICSHAQLLTKCRTWCTSLSRALAGVMVTGSCAIHLG